MLFFAIFLCFLLFFGVFGYTWYRLHKTMHLHASGGTETPGDYQLPFEKIAFSSKDNVPLSGWYIPAVHSKAIVILVHGRALTKSGKSMMLPHAKYLHDNQYSTFLLDMRSYGESEGKVVGFGAKEWQDVLAAYTYAQTLPDSKGKKIGFLGISLGATTSLITAGKEKVGDFVIASVPFANYSSLFAYQVEKEKVFPKLLFRWALQLAAQVELGLGYELYTALGFIQHITAPVLLIAGKKDTLVNPKDAWKLYEKANKPKEFWEADAGHDVYTDKKEEFTDHVLHFLATYTQ